MYRSIPEPACNRNVQANVMQTPDLWAAVVHEFDDAHELVFLVEPIGLRGA
jgi:hypothetical protein